MASRSVLGKRRRGNIGGRAFKRRKFRARKSSTYGNKSDSYGGIRYRARRWSRRRWNSTLWSSTQQKSHYRVAATWIDTITTPASATLQRMQIMQATDNGSGKFWEAGGGALDVDGGTMPLFTDDIVIRGGKVSITITFVDASVALGDHLKLRIHLVKGAKNVNLTNFNSSARDAAYDSTMFPEFRDVVGRIVLSRSFQLSPEQGSSRTISFRIPIQKVDIGAWSSLSTGRYYWVLMANNPANNTATVANITMSMNLSFSGDVIGST